MMDEDEYEDDGMITFSSSVLSVCPPTIIMNSLPNGTSVTSFFVTVSITDANQIMRYDLVKSALYAYNFDSWQKMDSIILLLTVFL